jgi:hypothetical protein
MYNGSIIRLDSAKINKENKDIYCLWMKWRIISADFKYEAEDIQEEHDLLSLMYHC